MPNICRKCGKQIEGTSSSKLFCEGHIPGRSEPVPLAYNSTWSSKSDLFPKLDNVVSDSSSQLSSKVKFLQTDSASDRSISNQSATKAETESIPDLISKLQEPVLIYYHGSPKPQRICRKCGKSIEPECSSEYFCSQHTNNNHKDSSNTSTSALPSSSKTSSFDSYCVVDVPLLPSYLRNKKLCVPLSQKTCRRCSEKVDHPGLSSWYCRPHYLELEQSLRKESCIKCWKPVHPDSKHYCKIHYEYIIGAHGKHPAVYLWSDIHVDYEKNWDSLRNLSEKKYSRDILILAGDVTDYLDRLEQAFTILNQKFKQLFFIPGNHELWVRKQPDSNSIQKLEMVKQVADKCGVKMSPEKVEIPSGRGEHSVWIVPLYSWYDGSLFMEVEGLDSSAEGWSDSYFCKWPLEYQESRKNPSCSGLLTDYFLSLNAPTLAQDYGTTPVITFSHFFSRPEQFLLIDGKGMCAGAAFNFSPVSGSVKLQQHINKLQPAVHCFGHSHRNLDLIFDGCRYVNNPLGYPLDRHEGILEATGPRKVWGAEDKDPHDQFD